MPETTEVATKSAPAVQEEEARPTLQDLLNKILMNGVVLTDSIPLGDALERLAVAIGRSGEQRREEGAVTITDRQVNKELGDLLLESLRRCPRTIKSVRTSFGWDPSRSLFAKGEALEIPINAMLLMLLPKDPSQHPVVIPVGDNPHTPGNI